MKRRKGELFYDYCARRLMNQIETKELMKPRMVHLACVLVPSPKKEHAGLPERDRPLVKVKAGGTYYKPKRRPADAVR